VDRNMIPGLAAPVQSELVMFSFGDITVPKGQYEPLCGEYIQIGLDPPHIGATAPFPGVGSGELSGIFFYNKVPQWTWDITKQGSEKSILDNLRYVVVEGQTGYNQGYNVVFMLVNFLWLVTMCAQYRAIIRMFFMLVAIPTTKGNMESVMLNDEGKWELTSMAQGTRVIGILVLIVRCGVVAFVGWEGFRFLSYTIEKVDLLLNSLALEFVLNMNYAFSALVSKTQQNFIDKLEPIKYHSVVPRKCFRPLRIVTGPSIVLFCVGGAFFARWWQLSVFKYLFIDAAALCLFAGPHPNSSTVMAPVTGLCESLLEVTCASSPQSKTGPPLGGPLGGPPLAPPQESCVITDFTKRWPKSVRHKSAVSLWPYAAFSGAGTQPDIWSWSFSQDPRIQDKFASVQDDLTTMLATVCMALYNPQQQPHEVCVDDDTKEMATAGPFSCRKDSGIRAYFENYVWAVTRSELWKRDDEAGGSWFPLMSKDPGLSSVLAKCH